MTNNDIFKKLRVALQLRDEQIVEILELVDFRISKGELGNVFRKDDHPSYMECGDQLLRNFLNGLVIQLRGTKEDPKNASDELYKIANSKIDLETGEKLVTTNKPAAKKPYTKDFPKKKFGDKPKFDDKPKYDSKKKPSYKDKPKRVEIIEKVKFNNGKPKKK
ncbi:DUF1456 family protein [uncultured Flavobacterium sp.]|uniref:DUF1456 family protein n=1 Tax=uncultured Flavobacterium sp. TaxID=165435 RepID=UPI0030EB3F4D|tara:strand:+ start:156121 stop:156609 length:489 start_codon:yes stop_codon:yes gene_type:complete